MKVLVTGAAGFLGGHLVDMLLERGDEVRAMVRPVEDASRLRKLDGIEVVLGDLVDRESLKRAVQGIQRVYNVAAKTGPWGFEKERGAPVVIVRPAWIYGPCDTASFGRFVAMVESGKGFLIGSGKNIVPVVYVRDVAQGLIKAGDSGDEAIGKAYTIADDRRVT